MKAIVTYGTGTCKAQLDISLPIFKAFAKRHGYDLFVAAKIGRSRHPVWYKIPLMIDLLKTYDEVLWLDSDMVIVNGRDDIPFPADYWQAMAFHHTWEGEVPNAGVWYVRKPMLPYLERAWNMTEYLNYLWREQSAIMKQMGYGGNRASYLKEPTELYRHTFQLENSWNKTPVDLWVGEPPRIQHIATCYTNVIETMKVWAMEAYSWINEDSTEDKDVSH